MRFRKQRTWYWRDEKEIQYDGEIKTRDGSHAPGLLNTQSRLEGAKWHISKEKQNGTIK